MKNICIVGCGTIGNLHSRNLYRFTNLFFHSRSKISAEKLFYKYGGKYIFNRFEDAIQSPDIDAIVISSPPEFHKGQIIKSLHAGKSVLVEKPMCISEGELAEIGKVVEDIRGDAFLMVAENYYYKPSLKKIKRLLNNQYIGSINTVKVKKLFRQPATGWKSQYGALLEGGIHFIALISDIFEDTPEKIDAYFPFLKNGEVERHSVIKLTYNTSATAELTYSWSTKSLTKGTFQTSYIIGDEGIIIFESNGMYIFLRSNNKKGLYIVIPDLMGYRGMIKDFLKCLDNKQRIPYSDFHKAERDLTIVFQAYKNLRA
jgi:predicted dehydrogenase